MMEFLQEGNGRDYIGGALNVISRAEPDPKLYVQVLQYARQRPDLQDGMDSPDTCHAMIVRQLLWLQHTIPRRDDPHRAAKLAALLATSKDVEVRIVATWELPHAAPLKTQEDFDQFGKAVRTAKADPDPRVSGQAAKMAKNLYDIATFGK